MRRGLDLRDMVSIAEHVAGLHEVESFKALDMHDVVFEAPVISFEREDLVDLGKPLGDCVRVALVSICRNGPQDVNGLQAIALDGESDPHVVDGVLRRKSWRGRSRSRSFLLE